MRLPTSNRVLACPSHSTGVTSMYRTSAMTYPAHHARARVKSVGIHKKRKTAKKVDSDTSAQKPAVLAPKPALVPQPVPKPSLPRPQATARLSDFISSTTPGKPSAAAPQFVARAPTVAATPLPNPFASLAVPNTNVHARATAHAEYMKRMRQHAAQSTADPKTQHDVLQRAREWLNSAEKLNTLSANRDTLDPHTRRRVEAGIKLAEIHDRLQRELDQHANAQPGAADARRMESVRSAMDAAASTLGLGRSAADISMPNIPVVFANAHKGGDVLEPGRKGIIIDASPDEKGLDVDHPSRVARDEEAWEVIRKLQEQLREKEEELQKLRTCSHSCTVDEPRADCRPDAGAQTDGAHESLEAPAREDVAGELRDSCATAVARTSEEEFTEEKCCEEVDGNSTDDGHDGVEQGQEQSHGNDNDVHDKHQHFRVASEDHCVGESEFHRQISELRRMRASQSRSTNSNTVSHHDVDACSECDDVEPMQRVPNSIEITAERMHKDGIETVPVSAHNVPSLDWSKIGLTPPSKDIICGQECKAGRGLYMAFDASANTSPRSTPAEDIYHSDAHAERPLHSKAALGTVTAVESDTDCRSDALCARNETEGEIHNEFSDADDDADDSFEEDLIEEVSVAEEHGEEVRDRAVDERRPERFSRPSSSAARTADGKEVRVVRLKGTNAKVQQRMKQSPLEQLADEVLSTTTPRQRSKATSILARAIRDTPEQALRKLSVDELKHLAIALGTPYERPKSKAVSAILAAAQNNDE